MVSRDRGAACSRAVPVALSIAGSDSGGGAGVQADLKTFEAWGVWGTTALTGVTAQNTLGVTDLLVLPPALVAAQIDAVASDLGVAAAKTGMLGSAAVVRAVAEALSRHRISTVVVDPVFLTSHGELLLEEVAVSVMRDELLPLCTVVTPNLPEAEALTGRRVEDLAGMERAAAEIARSGPSAVLVKGGHLGGERSPDLLWCGGEVQVLEGVRVSGSRTHGTGCTLSAAICAALARGIALVDACRLAKAFVTKAIEAGVYVGSGVAAVNPGWGRRPFGTSDADRSPAAG